MSEFPSRHTPGVAAVGDKQGHTQSNTQDNNSALMIPLLVGWVLLATAVMMTLPLAADLYVGNLTWRVFAACSGATAALAVLLIYGSRKHGGGTLTLRQAFLLTPLSWFAVSAVSALPFFFSGVGSVDLSLADSVFEAVSGITTTGATVISGLDTAPAGLLLWRAILQWMGGIGIIATAIAIFPALRIGGMQLFRTESSDRSEKAMPRVRQIAKTIGLVYISLTLLALLTYWLAGMPLFDASVHALTSISTGGYSTSDASFGRWDENGIQWFATLFMLAGSLPFVLYVRFIAGDRTAFWDRQVKTLVTLLAVLIAIIGAGLFASGQYTAEAAFRHAAFNLTSIVTTTGYASADYTAWGNLMIGVFFALFFVGGCTGSTSGGIKIFRLEVMAVMLKTHLLHLLYPRGVFPRSYNGRVLTDDIIGSVVAFFTVFIVSYAALTVGLMAFGLDFLASASGSAAALANIGPGLGETLGPAGNYASLPAGAKWLLSFGMLLGRLEIFTVLVLFLPQFWRS